MRCFPSLRLAALLNAHAAGAVEAGGLTGWMVRPEVAHHVVNPEDRLGLESVDATPLTLALPRLAAVEPETWVLALPVPGALGGLRGPRELNQAALAAGEAVVGAGGGIALVPYRVGPAIQWRVFAAERPFLPAAPYDAERQLSEAVLRAGQVLQRLDVAAGARPAEPELVLPPGYDRRSRASADRAMRLLTACELALADDGGSVSAYEAQVRAAQLRSVRDAAREALCAAVTWPAAPRPTQPSTRRSVAIPD